MDKSREKENRMHCKTKNRVVRRKCYAIDIKPTATKFINSSSLFHIFEYFTKNFTEIEIQQMNTHKYSQPMKYALEIVYRKATEQETHTDDVKQYGFNYFFGQT